VSSEGGVVVIGYGNPLRGDDGAGFHAALLLADDARAEGALVLARHQLTPELAEDISHAGLVVLVDAATAPATPGAVSIRPLPRVSPSAGLFSHHVDPASLLEFSEAWFGQAPPAMQVSVGIGNAEPGTVLSAAVAGAMPRIVDAVVDMIIRFRLRP
jgi:hydrogenase maturation protease